MLCIHCSTPIPDDSHFCMSCGADVSDPTSAATASMDEASAAHLVRMLREETHAEYEIEREIVKDRPMIQ